MQRVGRLIGIDESKVFIPYLRYILTSKPINDYYKSLGRGGLQINIGKQEILKAQIPIGPLSEQKCIAAILDKAFAAIDQAINNTEKNLRNAQRLYQNHLEFIFANKGNGWIDKHLFEIATFRNGMNFTKGSKGETIKIVGVKDFQNNFWIPIDNLSSVTINGKLSEIDLLKEGDILTVRSNGNPELIGRTILTQAFFGKVSHSGFTIRIRLNSPDILPEYLCHFLKSQKARKKLVESGTGVNIKSLNQVALSSLQISFPKTKKEQQTIITKFVSLSNETKKLQTIYQQKLKHLEVLKESILQKAFAGELNLATEKITA